MESAGCSVLLQLMYAKHLNLSLKCVFEGSSSWGAAAGIAACILTCTTCRHLGLAVRFSLSCKR